jgi:hypothetical protein
VIDEEGAYPSLSPNEQQVNSRQKEVEEFNIFGNFKNKSRNVSKMDLKIKPIQLTDKFQFQKNGLINDVSNRKRKRAKSNYQNFIDKIEGVELQEEYPIKSDFYFFKESTYYNLILIYFN